MTRPQLMPCRACGSPTVNVYRTVERPSAAFVMCDACGYRGRKTDDGDAVRAIHLWNRESNLKLCPFCGGASEIHDVDGEAMVVCPFCGIRTQTDTLEKVTETWNCRTEVD
jgi:transcription elongation factor Elf1|nr:MAG TPA: restriction alleviation protein [Caudoviricetes sp.]